jgi:hypothetical protein
MMRITPKQCAEAGIVLALLLVMAGLFTGAGVCYKLAAATLLLDLALPGAFRPFAFCWFNLSVWLGFLTSRILLSVIFILIIVPVAILRKLGGKDRLLLKDFKKSTSSVFTDRNIKFGADSLKQTY